MKTSLVSFVSPGIRLVAGELKATNLLSTLKTAPLLARSACVLVVHTLTRVYCCALASPVQASVTRHMHPHIHTARRNMDPPGTCASQIPTMRPGLHARRGCRQRFGATPGDGDGWRDQNRESWVGHVR